MTVPRGRNGSAARIFDPLGYCVLADDKGELSERLYGPIWMVVFAPGQVEFMVDTGAPDTTFTVERASNGAVTLRICDSDGVVVLNGPLPTITWLCRKQTVRMEQWDFYEKMV